MAISWKKSYIDSNPKFELLLRGSIPKLQKGEMTIVYECLERLERPSLAELVSCCEAHGYRELMKAEPSIERSVLYHLRRLADGTVGRVKHYQRPVVREI